MSVDETLMCSFQVSVHHCQSRYIDLALLRMPLCGVRPSVCLSVTCMYSVEMN